MNESIAISRNWGIANAGAAMALLGCKTAESVSRDVPASAEAMMRAVHAALENLIVITIEKRSAADFQAVRTAVFDTYSNAALALAPLVKIVFPPHALDRIARESFCELEADLREQALSSFGRTVQDQALFTAWTLRKIYDITSQISGATLGEVDAANAKQLPELVQNFSSYAIWTRFHLHCLLSAMRTQRPLFPEPLDLIIDGLRAAVNAYALIRRILDILIPQQANAVEPITWDEEDIALMAEADLDMQSEIA